MAFSLPTLLRAVLGKPPRLVCNPQIWNSGIDELHRRTGGRRESGAFLLGDTDGRTRRIRPCPVLLVSARNESSNRSF
jgi:hypothetical protein